MNISFWNNLYTYTVKYIVRNISHDAEKRESFVTSLIWLDSFEDELFKRYLKNDTFEMTNNDWFNICHKYIKKAKEINNRTIAYVFFDIWIDGRYVFTEYHELDSHTNFIKDATKKEVKFAKKHFSHVVENWYGTSREHHHHFNDAKVLEYRGHRFIIDDEWKSAWYIKNNNEVGSFELVWDWYYPIDVFIDLYEGWKE